ncbi:MAG: tRNA lysidine(34) synthetase TilS [Pseudomonadota bacterium]|nr:tRNA lysidine(34) synthetase TilS [Pseudomonadota bacterium]
MSVIDIALKHFFQRHPLPSHTTIGVAVSGGADSLCLSYHLSKYAKKNDLVLKAVTVDHGLRSESETEARYVHDLAKSWGISHTTLLWTGEKPRTRVEEKARQKRYDLILKWCKKNGISHLFLAHHIGDQAETFWTRLARGSGLNGLSAMSDYTPFHDIYLCRPFLSLKKDILVADIKKQKINWCEDSMNEDEAYERVRWRHRQQILSDCGLTPDRIGLSCRRLHRAKEALDFYANRFYDTLADLSPTGFFTIQEQAFSTLPDEIKLRVISKIFSVLNPQKTPVSFESTEQWIDNYPKSATLGGCVLVRQSGLLFIARELRRLSKPIIIHPNQITDWNDFCVLSSCSIQIQAGNQNSDLPYLIRRGLPHVVSNEPFSLHFMTGTKKELEKKFALDYKRKSSEIILILFKGKK